MPVTASSLLNGLLRRIEHEGEPGLVPHGDRPGTVPCPTTGRVLKVATIDAHTRAVCPRCLQIGRGAFVSFVSDLRMAYACPKCDEVVWVAP
jgi:ribosomal protein S27AE